VRPGALSLALGAALVASAQAHALEAAAEAPVGAEQAPTPSAATEAIDEFVPAEESVESDEIEAAEETEASDSTEISDGPETANTGDPTPPRRTQGKLLLTGGVSPIEGAAGGGLTPWAVIGGYGSAGQVGGNVFLTRVDVDDYRLDAWGVLVGFHDRVELSYARQRFDTQDVGTALGLGEGFAITQDIVGVKVRVLGDAVLDSDTWRPQVAVGVQHKRNDRGALLAAIGARDDAGTDFYVSATKLFLAQGLLVDATVRFTEANQTGLLGFGGDRHSGRRAQLEVSAAWLLRRNLAVGAEYRGKPDNLSIAREDDWWDVFVAWAPSRHVSVTVAYVDLGNVVLAEQRGVYASVQVGF
jgi:hypothetical protein